MKNEVTDKDQRTYEFGYAAGVAAAAELIEQHASWAGEKTCAQLARAVLELATPPNGADKEGP